MQSAPTTSYNSPEPRHMMLDQYNHRYYQTGLPSYHGSQHYGAPTVSDQACRAEAPWLTSDAVKP